MDDDCRSEELGADPHLAHDGAVRGSGRDDGDEAARLGNAARDPDAARERILLGIGHDLAHGRPRRVVCPRREHASRAAFEQCDEDLRHLLRGLPLGEHGLRRALSKLPVEVDPREAEVAVRQLGEPLERVVGARRPGANTLEQVAEIVAKPGHRAIVEVVARGSDGCLGDVGRPPASPPRGRSAAARRGALHRRPRPGRERAPRRRAALTVRTRAHHAARSGARRSSSPASSACSPEPTSPSSRGLSPPESTAPVPHYAAAHETTRYVGEPVAVVVARDRYLAEDALELIDVEYEPLEPVLDAEAAVETDACVSDRSFTTATSRARFAGADLVVRERFRFPRWSCTPVECYGVVATGTRPRAH